MGFKELLGKKMLFFDGATGTQLQARGLKPGELTESWNFTHPEIVEAVHRGYLDAGADIVKTNTFGANPVKLAGSGLDTESTVSTAVAIAKKACAGRNDKFVALDLGPTGKLLEPYGDLPFEEAIAAYGETVRAGVKAGADLILIETMSDTYEIKAAIIAARGNSELPICVTMTFDEDGKLLTGADVESASIMCEALGVDAVGFNCGLGPEQVGKLLPRMLASVTIPVIINPNAGIPVQRDGKTCFDITPEVFSNTMSRLAAKGVSLVGGCCGTTPEHIGAMIAKCRGLAAGGWRKAELTAVSSYGRTVFIGDDPVLVGECVNPAGRKRLKEALATGDMDYVCRLALDEVRAGAQILDINVGSQAGDEAEILAAAVKAVQAVTDVPLAIDTANPVAMERALRAYNGKALLNSVSGTEESLKKMLPLAQKYGAAIVALCFDDKGIPDSAAGRIAVADKIIARAAAYGINRRNILFDPLAVPVKTGSKGVDVFYATLRILKERGLRSIAGVSNLSFGSCEREAVNRAAFASLLDEGLSAGIVNPLSKAVMDTYYGFRALSGLDEGCKDYVARFANAPKAAPTVVSEMGLYDAIVKGLQGEARKAAALALKTEPPLTVINSYMIPALDYVGNSFEKKTLFLPQLLMSADAAKAAFEVIKEAVGTSETQGETVIIATVRGDIHDIGKNIVKVLLENYGYRVLDLGKDVPVDRVVKSAQETGAKVVGLSALMTTTVGAMKETIIELHRACDCKVVVGGAVLTQEYADTIGAEHYAPNAVSAVSYVNTVFGK